MKWKVKLGGNGTMLEPLKQFVCDMCGEVIDRPEDGWIEWICETDESGPITYGFKIVHHSSVSPMRDGCYHYDGHPNRRDMHLDDVMNMGYLLSFLDLGPFHDPDYSGPSTRDTREFVEIMRRLTIPHYEEARLHWEKALAGGFFNGADEVSIYRAANLKMLIEQYAEL